MLNLLVEVCFNRKTENEASKVPEEAKGSKPIEPDYEHPKSRSWGNRELGSRLSSPNSDSFWVKKNEVGVSIEI